MRVNAFLGNADLSMILHMLSQRSDTDLLSAPKVVTKSGQEAIMKVVTEYIYPTEFEVQEVNTSGGSSTSSATHVPVPFMVEPQNFEMREVGVILQVVPEVSAEGQMINLLLNPQVVSEPVWKNYGTKIPGLMTQEYTICRWSTLLPCAVGADTLSVYNGATVVMGGLITEDRKTMEDKIPFLATSFLGVCSAAARNSRSSESAGIRDSALGGSCRPRGADRRRVCVAGGGYAFGSECAGRWRGTGTGCGRPIRPESPKGRDAAGQQQCTYYGMGWTCVHPAPVIYPLLTILHGHACSDNRRHCVR